MRLPRSDRWSDEVVELFLLEPHHATTAYLEWLEDPQVNRYLESRFAVHSVQSIRSFIEAASADPNTLFLGIHSRTLGRHVGNIKLQPIDYHHRLGEVGILVGDRSAWGRGVGSAAISRMADIAARDLGLRKLSAGSYASNAGSVRAFQRAGFVIEGVRRGHVLLDDRPEDVILMGRLLIPPTSSQPL